MEQRSIKRDIQSLQNSEDAFEQVFKEKLKALHAYAFTFVQDSDVAEDMVQSAFIKFWERSKKMHIHTSVTSYLYKAVYNNSLNHLKHQKVKNKHAHYIRSKHKSLKSTTEEQMKGNEIQTKITEALKELPEGCRTIFQMSRFEALKYREIAEKLDISVKTVENQMGKALKIMRLKLSDYLMLLLVLLIIHYL